MTPWQYLLCTASCNYGRYTKRSQFSHFLPVNWKGSCVVWCTFSVWNVWPHNWVFAWSFSHPISDTNCSWSNRTCASNVWLDSRRIAAHSYMYVMAGCVAVLPHKSEWWRIHFQLGVMLPLNLKSRTNQSIIYLSWKMGWQTFMWTEINRNVFVDKEVISHSGM